MNLKEKMQRRLKLSRPSLRARARPPKHRTTLGAQFTAANLSTALALQHCKSCGHTQYPPTELCGICLEDQLIYQPADGAGVILAKTELHHSLWEYFKRRLRQGSWPLCSVALNSGPKVIAHLGSDHLKAGDPARVFSHTDASQQAVLIAVDANVDVSYPEARREIVSAMNLDIPAIKEDGL